MKSVKICMIIRCLLCILGFPVFSILSSILVRNQHHSLGILVGLFLYFLFAVVLGGYSVLTYHNNRSNIGYVYGLVAYITIAPSFLMLTGIVFTCIF